MKRRGEVATALILAILSAIVIGAGVYYVAQTRQNTPGKMNTSEDPRAEQELNDLAQEITSELSGKFGEFSSLESYDFVPSVRMEWGEKALYQAGDRYCFMIPEEFVRKFISLTEPGTLEVSDDGSNFGIDIHNGKDFNLDKTLSELLHQVSGLEPGVSSNPVDIRDVKNIRDVKSKIENRVTAKSAESYGYVRFIFKTNVDDVYFVAVFSIDPNEGTHAKGRYIATGRKLLISRSSGELLEGIKTRLTFGEYFYTLDFDLNTPNVINSNSSVEECLEKFIAQFEE